MMHQADADSKKKMKRYHLVIPVALYNQLEAEADLEDTQVVELIRKFIKFGLIAAAATRQDDTELILRHNGTEKTIMLV